MHNLHIAQSIVSTLKEFALVFNEDCKCHPFTIFFDVQTKQQLWHLKRGLENHPRNDFLQRSRTLFAIEEVCYWLVCYHISGRCLQGGGQANIMKDLLCKL